MNQTLLTALIAGAVVGVLALLLRMFSSRADEQVTMPAPGEAQAGARLEDLEPVDEEPGADEAVAITSDGWAFVPDGRAVHLVPPGEPEELLVRPGPEGPMNPKTRQRLGDWRPGQHLDVGDFVAARVKRGAPGVDPWRLETLGRDRDYHAWAFETEEAARAAHDLVVSRIVRPPRDAAGDEVVIGAQDFEVARQEQEQIAAELANMPDVVDAPEDDLR